MGQACAPILGTFPWHGRGGQSAQQAPNGRASAALRNATDDPGSALLATDSETDAAAAPINITVNGFPGPRCTLSASTEWTIQQEAPAAAPNSQPEAFGVSVVVIGLSGHRCTVEASNEWTVRQVQQAISAMISVPVEWQTLVKDSERLPLEATVGSLLADEAADSLQLMLLVQEVWPINFVGMQNGLQQLEPGHLRKTSGVGLWTSGAVSSESFVVGQGRGLRFRPGTTDNNFMIGLGSRSAAPTSPTEIDYAAFCCGDSQFYVCESGEFRFSSCPYSRTSTVELRATEGQVEFLVDGVVKHTSQLHGQERLYAMATFLHVGGEALQIQWL